jgi:hypothetical protein
LFEGLCYHHKYTFKPEEALHKYLPVFPADVKARHDKMVGPVETMRKVHMKNRTLTADSLRLAAPDGCSSRNTPEPLAVSRKRKERFS